VLQNSMIELAKTVYHSVSQQQSKELFGGSQPCQLPRYGVLVTNPDKARASDPRGRVRGNFRDCYFEGIVTMCGRIRAVKSLPEAKKGLPHLTLGVHAAERSPN